MYLVGSRGTWRKRFLRCAICKKATPYSRICEMYRPWLDCGHSLDDHVLALNLKKIGVEFRPSTPWE